MTLSDLLALAEKANAGGWYKGRILKISHDDDAYITACSPEVVAALVRVANAADELRGDGYEPRPGIARVQAYDAARAELDRVLGAER